MTDISHTPTTSGAVSTALDTTGVLEVVLNRPEAANARNQAMRDDLASLWSWTGQSDKVNVVLLRAAGDRHFCAGMDLKEANQAETPHERRTRMRRTRDIEMLAALPQPTIAAVNGAALGGGLEMALACDLRILASTARVGLPEVSHGLLPGGGGTFRLPRLIGVERAMHLMLTGTILDAPQAVELGIAMSQVPADQLLETSRGLANRIATHPSASVRAIVRCVRTGLHQPDHVNADRELDELLWLLAARAERTPATERSTRGEGDSA